MTRDELIERLADIEHQRWAGWQEYLHSKAGPDPTHSGQGALLLMPEDVAHWKRLIATDYADLPEHSKQADRDEVMKYWPLFVEFVYEWIMARPYGALDRPSLAIMWREEMTEEG